MSTETKPLTDSDVAELAEQLRASLSGRKTRKRRIVEITPRTSCGHEATIDALTGELAEMRLRVRPCACPYCPSGCGRMSQPESDPPVCGECQHGEHVCAVAELAAARRKLERVEFLSSAWSAQSHPREMAKALAEIRNTASLTEGEAQDGAK